MPPRVGHILRLAEIIREVDGNHSLGAAALAEAILSHPDVAGCGLCAGYPIPVAERLPGPEDLKNGRCWLWDSYFERWYREDLEFFPEGHDLHWLPYDALPLPTHD